MVRSSSTAVPISLGLWAHAALGGLLRPVKVASLPFPSSSPSRLASSLQDNSPYFNLEAREPSPVHAALEPRTTAVHSIGSLPSSCQGVSGSGSAGYYEDYQSIVYEVYCGQDNVPGHTYDYYHVYSGGYQYCFPACDLNSTCAGFVWVTQDEDYGDCYLKSTEGAYSAGATGSNRYMTAYKRTLSGYSTTPNPKHLPIPASPTTPYGLPTNCSNDLGTTSTPQRVQYTTSNSSGTYSHTYDVYCGCDNVAANDDGVATSSTGYEDCFGYCDASPECTSWTWVSNNNTFGDCYLQTQSEPLANGTPGKWNYVTGNRVAQSMVSGGSVTSSTVYSSSTMSTSTSSSSTAAASTSSRASSSTSATTSTSARVTTTRTSTVTVPYGSTYTGPASATDTNGQPVVYTATTASPTTTRVSTVTVPYGSSYTGPSSTVGTDGQPVVYTATTAQPTTTHVSSATVAYGSSYTGPTTGTASDGQPVSYTVTTAQPTGPTTTYISTTTVPYGSSYTGPTSSMSNGQPVIYSVVTASPTGPTTTYVVTTTVPYGSSYTGPTTSQSNSQPVSYAVVTASPTGPTTTYIRTTTIPYGSSYTGPSTSQSNGEPVSYSVVTASPTTTYVATITIPCGSSYTGPSSTVSNGQPVFYSIVTASPTGPTTTYVATTTMPYGSSYTGPASSVSNEQPVSYSVVTASPTTTHVSAVTVTPGDTATSFGPSTASDGQPISYSVVTAASSSSSSSAAGAVPTCSYTVSFVTSPTSSASSSVSSAASSTSSVASSTSSAAPSVSSAASSTSSTVSSTSSAAAATGTPYCPTADGQTVTDSSGTPYTIQCASDSSAGSYSTVQVQTSFYDCMTACDADSSCTAWTYVGANGGQGSGYCYLKNPSGIFISSGSNIISGVKSGGALSSSSAATSSAVAATGFSLTVSFMTVSATGTGSGTATSSGAAATGSVSSCASVGSTTYTDNNGVTYQVACGVDFYGDDLSAANTNSFGACLTLCDRTSRCVGMAYVGGTGPGVCYMKSQIAAGQNNANVDSAKCIANCPGSTSSASSSATSALSSNAACASSSVTTSSSTVAPSTSQTTSGAAAGATSGTCAQLAGSGSKFTDANGKQYTLECGIDRPGGDLSAASSSSFAGCFTICDATAGCVGFSFVGGSGAGVCYMKSNIVGPNTNSGVDSGYLVSAQSSSSSSAAASTTAAAPVSSSSVSFTTAAATGSGCAAATSGACSSFPTGATDANGVSYTNYCGTDFYGQDLSAAAGSSFAACYGICDNTPGCQGFSFVGGSGAGTCYLKASIASGLPNSNVDAAIKQSVAATASGFATVTSSSAVSVTSAISSASRTTTSSPPPSPTYTGNSADAVTLSGCAGDTANKFKLKASVISGNSSYNGMYLQAPVYNASRSFPLLDTCADNVAQAYLDPSTTALGLWQGSCMCAGFGMVNATSGALTAGVLYFDAMGSKGMAITNNQLTWTNAAFGGWVVCRSQGVNELQYQPSNSSGELDGNACASINLVTESM